MKKLRVALIFGGTSEEREVSINSSKVVAANLNLKKYDVIPVEVAKDGKWLKKIQENYKNIDVAFLALHGPGGEDGAIQGMLDLLKIPYTCSGVLASALAMDKAKTKRLVASEGILVAPHIIIKKIDFKKNPNKYLSTIKGKVVVKPNRIGSSLGVTITSNKTEIKKGITEAFKHDEEVMIEAFVSGRELTVPVLGNKKLQALPVIEIVPTHGSKFFDFRAKYNPNFSDEIVPAPIPNSLAKNLQEQAVLVHEMLDCRGMTRSDFIVTQKGQVYFLEINTIPGMTNNSLVPKAAKVVGISYQQLLDKLIELALDKE